MQQSRCRLKLDLMMYLQWKSPGRLFRYLIIVDTAKPMKVKVCFNDVSSIQWKSPGRLFRYLIIVDAAKSMKVKVCFDDVSTVEIPRPTVSISCYCRYSKAEVVYILI